MSGWKGLDFFVGALKFPILFWVLFDTYFWLITMHDEIGGAVGAAGAAINVLVAAVGVWAGWSIVRHGGTRFDAILAGVLVGLVCGGLGFLLFSFAREGGDPGAVFPGSVVDFSMTLAGAVLGGWWALSMSKRPGAS